MVKGHMQDGKFHPHTPYQKGVRMSRDQKVKTQGVIRLARSSKLSEKQAKNFWNRLTPRSKFDVLTLELDLFLGNIPEHNEGKSFFDRSFDELPTKYQNLIRSRTLKQLKRFTGLKGTPVQAFSPLSIRKKREVKLIATPIKMPARAGMAWFTKANALKLEERVKPFVGKKVLLFGGGGDSEDVVTLKSVKAEPTIKFHDKLDPRQRLPRNATIIKQEDNQIQYTTPNDYVVNVSLQKKPEKFSGIWRTGIFEPHLGSWRLASLEES